MNAKANPQPTLPDPALALERALTHLISLQSERGHWEGEVVWSPMITAQYVMVATITGQPLTPCRREGILRHFLVTQRSDGSWGMHIQSEGHLFITTMVYVAMRLLGEKADAPHVASARAWLRERGGVLGVPTWGKVWLSLMNLYDWKGVNPVLPELWLLPDSNPVHPRRYYCHTRMIYLAIGVLYAKRLQHPITPLLRSLREELYTQPYEQIDFSKHRDTLYHNDIYDWPGTWTKLGYRASLLAQRFFPQWLRTRALKRCMELIVAEVQNTRHACISPVNGLLNALALWSESPKHPDFLPTFEGLDYWMWEDDTEGIRYAGARSQTWDTSFAVQAICAAPKHNHASDQALRRALQYLREHQQQEELADPARWYRLPIQGGWCFSDKHHRWPVSDCTAEALSALRDIQERLGQTLPLPRLEDAARFLLQRQNPDGGWGSYENRRGNWFLEQLNPSEMYGNCMLEHSYIECTASCIAGLDAFLQLAPNAESNLRNRAQQAIHKGAHYLRSAQLDDGSWPGFWGVNFTYATWFGVMGLRKAGAPTSDHALQKAVRWLKQTQLPDGGWGESWRSHLEERYIPAAHSQEIQTSWAVMALLLAGVREEETLRPAINLLCTRQTPDGGWTQTDAAGVFFNTAMLDYKLYKHTFPTWALSLYQTLTHTKT